MEKKLQSIKEIVEKSYLQTLKNTFKENLLSVMVYGSYVSGDFIPGISDINILILLEKPLTDQVAALGKNAHTVMRKYRITPLILTRTEFINSADVFPMEYSDIKARNSVLFGDDETKLLPLKKNNLRHQLEERLRGSVTSLRQMIIASARKKKFLESSLKILFGSLKALFRGLLRLKDTAGIPVEGEEVIRKVQSEFKVNGEPFLKLLAIRKGEKHEPNKLAGEVLASLEQLISIVDKMGT